LESPQFIANSMHDDSTFIAGIQATPDDDARRLVYADWLEEQGQTEKAEYLRVVNALSELPNEAPLRRRLVRRLLIVSDQIDERWRDAVARRFDLVVEGLLGGALNVILKAVRWLTGGRAIGEMTPHEQTRAIVLRRGIRREEAEAELNRIDSTRFRLKRTNPSPWRIVPAKSTALSTAS
jgi:uncharacterized protein (TIGR02996 family)